jgi:hypothetical protein
MVGTPSTRRAAPRRIGDFYHPDRPEPWSELLASKIVIIVGDARAAPTFREIGRRSEGAARGALGLADLFGFGAQATN